MKHRIPAANSAFILVDIQNDFCPGGALAVPEGNLIVEPVNRLMPLFPFVAATKDWHPANHCSFRQFGGDWPPHCIQNTFGAELHRGIDIQRIDLVAVKGFTREKDVFQGLNAEGPDGTTLDTVLRDRNVETIFVAGLATDYCVHGTVLDAIEKGYKLKVILGAIKAVDVKPGDGDRAIREMISCGAEVLTSHQLLGTGGFKRTIGH
jgi:nicotinamidase/pyrazinamidase